MNSAELELLYIEAVTNSEALRAELAKSKETIRGLELKIADEMDMASAFKKKINEKEKSIDSLNGEIQTVNNALEDAKDLSVFTTKLKKMANASLNISKDWLEDYRNLLNHHVHEALHKYSIRIAPKKVSREDAKKIVEQFNLLGHKSDPFSKARKESFRLEIDADAKQFHVISNLLGCTERMSTTPLEDMRSPVDALLALDEMYESFRENVADILIYEFGEKVVLANETEANEAEFASSLADKWINYKNNNKNNGFLTLDDFDNEYKITATEALARQNEKVDRRILDNAEFVKDLAEALANEHIDMQEASSHLEDFVVSSNKDLSHNVRQRIYEMLLWTLQVEHDTLKAKNINIPYEHNP